MSDVAEAFEPTSSEPVVQPKSSSKGCLYGCLFVVVSGIALMVCAGVGGYWWVTTQVQKYTSTTPADLPTVEFTPERMAELEKRVDAFSEAMDQGETPQEDLELTAEEINALIGSNDDMRGKVFVRIEDGQVSGDISIPTDPIPGGKGRFFNGSASLDVSMDDGILIVTLADAEVNGERLPQEIIDAMANENLAKDVYKDPKNAKVLRKFKDISVQGDKILLKMRHEEASDDSNETEAADGDSTEEASAEPTESKPSETKPADGDSTEEAASEPTENEPSETKPTESPVDAAVEGSADDDAPSDE